MNKEYLQNVHSSLGSKIDLAVHSLKDLPTKETEGLCVKSVIKRNDPRDAFLSYSSKSFNETEDFIVLKNLHSAM